MVGHLCEGFHQEDLESGLLYWGTRKIRFLREKDSISGFLGPRGH